MRQQLLTQLFPREVCVASLDAADAVPPAIHPQEMLYVAGALPARQREFAAGRACARAALNQLGVGHCALPAKPDRSPQWPAGIVGSISHARGDCVAVAARQKHFLALGVDLEFRTPFDDALLREICTPDELGWLDSLPAARRDPSANLLFCAKEAFYKCQYPLTGRWLEFTDISVQIGAGTLQLTHAPAALLRLPWIGRYFYNGDRILAGFCLPAVA